MKSDKKKAIQKIINPGQALPGIPATPSSTQRSPLPLQFNRVTDKLDVVKKHPGKDWLRRDGDN